MSIKQKSIEEKYIHLEHRDQILLRPSSTIGSIITEERNLYLIDDINNLDEIKIVNKSIPYNPGFFQIIEEILNNASDHFIKTGEVKYIKVNVYENEISVENDGPGIPVVIHKKEKIYLPELLFGNTFTSENYDDTITRTWGGQNGIGAKSTNIFSKKFIVETSDGKKYYHQEFSENMSKKTKPIIKKSNKNYTKITFIPDYERFGLEKIDDDIKSFIFMRCLDISVYCQGIKIYFNNYQIPIKNFKDYIKLFVNQDYPMFLEKLDDNWEIGFTKSIDNSFNQLSMVNGIKTYKGGTHINYISNQIVKNTLEILTKKYKNLNIKPNDIKNKIFLFVNAKIIRPTFDEQTKETLNSKINNNPPVISDKLIKQFSNSQIIDELIKYLNIKEQVDTKKEIIKHKIKISKLDDAPKAGTSESHKCSLVISEGDSASSSVISGLSEVDSNYWGVFPLRGKPLNVKNSTLQKIKDNEEIKNIINILGLEFGKKYTDTNKLRYGKLIICSDMDVDGAHIKSLVINLFDTFWPELLKLDFLYEFITPILKIYDNKKFVKYFYRLGEWNKYKNENNIDNKQVKYFKGIGTVEPSEMKLFFRNINKHLIRFHYDSDSTNELIDLVLNQSRSNDRKEWMKSYNPNNFIDKFVTKQTYEKFINSELMEWSMADNHRMIPSIVDGLKPSQRKVIYTLFKNNMKNEIKVSSLSGSVIQDASYHNGNISLEQTIVNMAQDFVGANNLNLILPKGQFGTRLKGGSDSASARYIFVKLNEITNHILNKKDNPILDYLDDDGFLIEPKYYVPIIPMILVNGGSGIGSGYSTDIPSYNPNDIITYLQNKLKNKKNIELNPYYKNFKGEIIMDIENKRYITRGILNKINEFTYDIKELPLWVWNDKYYEFLDDLANDKKEKDGKLVRKAYIKNWIKKGNDKDIDIRIFLTKDIPDNFIEDIYKNLKLESYVSFNNLHLFDKDGKIKKYQNQYEIIEDFINIRLEYYTKRKEYEIGILNKNINILNNKIKFLKLVIDGKVVINKRSKDSIEKDLEVNNLDKIEESYSYLLNMPIYSFTKEKLQDLKESFDKLKNDLHQLEQSNEKDIWLGELSDLKTKLKDM